MFLKVFGNIEQVNFWKLKNSHFLYYPVFTRCWYVANDNCAKTYALLGRSKYYTRSTVNQTSKYLLPFQIYGERTNFFEYFRRKRMAVGICHIFLNAGGGNGCPRSVATT